MTRRAEQIPLDDDWVLTKVWSKSRAAPAILAAIQSVPRDEAFIPALSAGPAFDSPEVVPLSAEPVGNQPPNCDGNAQFGYEPAQAGQILAHAQHSVAEGSDDECSSGRCLIAGSVAVQSDNDEAGSP